MVTKSVFWVKNEVGSDIDIDTDGSGDNEPFNDTDIIISGNCINYGGRVTDDTRSNVCSETNLNNSANLDQKSVFLVKNEMGSSIDIDNDDIGDDDELFHNDNNDIGDDDELFHKDMTPKKIIDNTTVNQVITSICETNAPCAPVVSTMLSICVSNTAISTAQLNTFGNIGNISYEHNPLNSNINAHEAKTNTSTHDPNDMLTICYNESFDSNPSTPTYTIPTSTTNTKKTRGSLAKKKIMFLHSKNKASRKGYKGEC